MKNRWMYVLMLAIAATAAGCLTGRMPGNFPLPDTGNGGTVQDTVLYKPAEVFTWHPVGMLDARGGGTAALGIAAYRDVGITMMGVHYKNPGLFDNGYHYINAIRDSLGGRVIRTLPTFHHMATLERHTFVNFGKWISDWKNPGDPGEFVRSITDSIPLLCDGLGFDVEEDILNLRKYPLSIEDEDLARAWGLRITNEDGYVTFRNRQIATLARLIFLTVQKRHPSCAVAIVYSAYQGDTNNGHETRASYGCDWELMTSAELQWNGFTLPKITHAMLAYVQGPKIPDRLVRWARTLPVPILYNVQTYVPEGADYDAYHVRKTEQVLRNIRPGKDGVGFVDFDEDGEAPQLWDDYDARTIPLIASVRKRAK